MAVDHRLLQAFVVLAEELHFTRASERLGITQPQMSQWIRKLEQRCGAPLVERSTRVVRLTPAGRAALPHAKAAVESMRLLQRSVQLDDTAVVGAVTLGYAGASSRPLLPEITRHVRQLAPGVELTLQSLVYAGAAASHVLSGDLDIAFSRRPLTQRGLVDRVVEYERILAAVPSDHPLARNEVIDVADLVGESWVMFPAGRGSSVRDMGTQLTRAAGFVPRIAQEAPDSYTILGLVAAGVGVTLTVASVAHVSTPGLALRPIAGAPQYLAATILHSAHPTRAARLVLDIIEHLHPTPPRPDGVVWE